MYWRIGRIHFRQKIFNDMAPEHMGCRSPIRSAVFAAYFVLIGCGYEQYRADDELASRIDAALLSSDELNLSRIEVTAEPGVVYLSGMSDDHESKVHAEKEALAIAPDRKIINKIEVDF